ncbi:MAG TPA: hypothetical protein VMR41_04175, partial [Patescibacteria group bacterium]|nr:hypothetical protein [Patescibacteria group bacterium]
DAIGTSNGLLGDIKNAINSGFNAVTGLLGSILNKPVNVGDTSAFDTTGLHSGDTIFDSTGTVPSFGDSGAQWSSFRAKMDSIRRIDSSDTNITVDSNGISHIFDSLKVNWGDTSDCGCDSTAITIPFWNKNYPVNLCFGDPAQYTKPIFKLLAGIFIFLFYRFSVFQVIIKVFANII